MSAHDETPMTPDEARAAAAVSSLRAAAPDPEFRARLKREFVTGQIAPRLRVHRSPMARVTQWALPLAAAVALAVGAAVVNRGNPWRVLDAHTAGSLIVDGHQFAASDDKGIDAALHDGSHLQFDGDGILELGSGGQVLFQLNPGTDMVLPKVAGRFWGREMRASIRTGEVRVMTGPGFHGARLAIQSPESDVTVTGTIFSVICFPNATCVCVWKGQVGVAEHGKEPMMIQPGRRRMIFNDGTPPVEDAMLPIERERLGAFESVEGPMLEGGRP